MRLVKICGGDEGGGGGGGGHAVGKMKGVDLLFFCALNELTIMNAKHQALSLVC